MRLADDQMKVLALAALIEKGLTDVVRLHAIHRTGHAVDGVLVATSKGTHVDDFRYCVVFEDDEVAFVERWHENASSGLGGWRRVE